MPRGVLFPGHQVPDLRTALPRMYWRLPLRVLQLSEGNLPIQQQMRGSLP